MARFTIVTANLNHSQFLAEALRSAADQADVDLDHLVIDGGSSDRSVEVVQGWPGVRLELCPGLDSHGALNHGLALAQGDVIGFLNADDRYEPASLARVAAAFDAEPSLQAVCAGMRFFRVEAGREIEIRRYRHQDGAALLLETTFGAPGFNSWFFRTTLLRDLGGFCTRWRFAADRDLLMRLVARTRPRVLDDLVYHYRVHEGSRTLDPRKPNRTAWAREHIRLARRHAAGDWADLPGGVALLDDWRALEGLKLLVGLRPHPGWRSDVADLAATPWWRLPAALRRRRQWLALAAA